MGRGERVRALTGHTRRELGSRLEFAFSGHREVEHMIAQHARIAHALGEQLGLSDDILAALAAAYEMWDGRGWPGELKGDEVPSASRVAQLAEFVEVAYRAGGVAAATALARRSCCSTRWHGTRSPSIRSLTKQPLSRGRRRVLHAPAR